MKKILYKLKNNQEYYISFIHGFYTGNLIEIFPYQGASIGSKWFNLNELDIKDYPK